MNEAAIKHYNKEHGTTQVITSLIVENRVLKADFGSRWLRLVEAERRRLARPVGRERLKEVASLATPDMLLRW